MPVLAGAGGYNTDEVAHLARELEDLGVQGILSVTPYYNKPTQEGLVRHYSAIASRTALPIIVYNVPGRTGCNVEPRTLARLAAVPNIVGVKEASGQHDADVRGRPPRARRLHRALGRRCADAAADGGGRTRHHLGGVEQSARPDGRRMVEAAERGDFAAARAEHQRLMRLMLVNFVESNPIPVKAAMAMLGLLEESYRLPMVPPSESSRRKIRRRSPRLGLGVTRTETSSPTRAL